MHVVERTCVVAYSILTYANISFSCIQLCTRVGSQSSAQMAVKHVVRARDGSHIHESCLTWRASTRLRTSSRPPRTKRVTRHRVVRARDLLPPRAVPWRVGRKASVPCANQLADLEPISLSSSPFQGPSGVVGTARHSHTCCACFARARW
jgi:hypothetical protein